MFLDAFTQRPSGFPDIIIVTILTLQTVDSSSQLIRRRFVFGRYEQLAKSLVRFERSVYPHFVISSAYLIRDALNVGNSRINSPSCRLLWFTSGVRSDFLSLFEKTQF